MVFGAVVWSQTAFSCDFDASAEILTRRTDLPANSTIVIDAIFDDKAAGFKLIQGRSSEGVGGQEVPAEVTFLQKRGDDGFSQRDWGEGYGVVAITPNTLLEAGVEITVVQIDEDGEEKDMGTVTVVDALDATDPLDSISLALNVEVFTAEQEDLDFCNGDSGTLVYTLSVESESEVPFVVSVSGPRPEGLPQMRVRQRSGQTILYLDPVGGEAPCLDVVLFSPLTGNVRNVTQCPSAGLLADPMEGDGCAQVPAQPSQHWGWLVLALGWGLMRRRVESGAPALQE